MQKNNKLNNEHIEIDDKDAEFLKQDKLEFERKSGKKNFYILYTIAAILILVIIYTLTQLLSSIDEISEILDQNKITVQDTFTLEDRINKEGDIQNYLGDWVGTWLNISSGNTGVIDMNASIDNGKVILIIDLNGRVFGLYNPKQKTLVGDILEDGVYFEINKDRLFGNVKAKIDYKGNIEVNGFKIPLKRVDAVKGAGYISENNVNVDYTVEWVKGIKTVGKVELGKKVELGR